MARPGIMFYFDMWHAIRNLPDSDKGRLLDAIMEYGESNRPPVFEDKTLFVAWGFIQSRIDRDKEAYDDIIFKRKYAAECKRLRSKNIEVPSFDEWKRLTANGSTCSHMDTGATGCNRVESDGAEWNPTTTPTTNTSTAISTATTPTTATATTTATTTATAPTTATAAASLPSDPSDFESLRKQKMGMLRHL